MRLLHGLEDADTVELPHPQIGEDDVVGTAGAEVGALIAIAGLVDLVARAAQHHGQRRAHVALVIDDENLRHQSSPPRVRWPNVGQRSRVIGVLTRPDFDGSRSDL